MKEYPIRGLLHCLLEKSMTLEEVEGRITAYMTLIEKRAGVEVKLQQLRESLDKPEHVQRDEDAYRRLRDMGM